MPRKHTTARTEIVFALGEPPLLTHRRDPRGTMKDGQLTANSFLMVSPLVSFALRDGDNHNQTRKHHISKCLAVKVKES